MEMKLTKKGIEQLMDMEKENYTQMYREKVTIKKRLRRLELELELSKIKIEELEDQLDI